MCPAATTRAISSLSLHDALPIYRRRDGRPREPHGSARELPADEGARRARLALGDRRSRAGGGRVERSEDHTSELQSPVHLVCRHLIEKKKKSARLTSTPLHYATA